MISRDLVLTITDKTTTLDKTIILYRYDRGITFNITLKSDTYNISESEICKARAIILRPNKKVSATEISDIVNEVYVLYLDDTWTDHLGEVGTYTIQLQLYSDNIDDECITIQPFTFEVKAPIGIPQDSAAYVDLATTDNYGVSYAAGLPTGDLENGEYLETSWITGDLITSGKLNKIESVIDYLVADSATHATEDYVTNAISEAQLDGGNADLSDYALKTEIPSNVSELTNDAGYLTSIPDEVITEEELNNKGYLTEHQDISNLASKDHTHDEYLTEHQSLEGYATEQFVTDAIAEIDMSDIDLSDYALKTDIPTVPTKLSELTNDSGFITSIPDEYVTDSELNDKGYLTEHQSLEGYVTKEELDAIEQTLQDLNGSLTEPTVTYNEEEEKLDISGYQYGDNENLTL